MMDAKLKADWVKALRSGKYQQATSCLRSRNNSFCCLGVALDIQKAEWRGREAVLNGQSVDMLGTPTPEMLGGLSSDAANILTLKNDGVCSKEHTFLEIADYIEANL